MPSTLVPRTRRLIVTTTLAASVTAALTACGTRLPRTPRSPAPPQPPSRTPPRPSPVEADRYEDRRGGRGREEDGRPRGGRRHRRTRRAERRHGREQPRLVDRGVTPGEKGVSVLVAHFDTKHGPALMKDVKKIKLGDLIEVPREDGRTAKFKIREIEDVNKKDFPTDKVYADTQRPELRLLTCGGEIKDGHRTNNIIFYADLTPDRRRHPVSRATPHGKGHLLTQ